MVEIQPLQIAIEREEDGRFLASVPELRGVMAYGDTEEIAVRKTKSIALQVLADMIESGEESPQPLKVFEEIGPAALAKISKDTGLTPEDL